VVTWGLLVASHSYISGIGSKDLAPKMFFEPIFGHIPMILEPKKQEKIAAFSKAKKKNIT
jgi:hypothetical protein